MRPGCQAAQENREQTRAGAARHRRDALHKEHLLALRALDALPRARAAAARRPDVRRVRHGKFDAQQALDGLAKSSENAEVTSGACDGESARGRACPSRSTAASPRYVERRPDAYREVGDLNATQVFGANAMTTEERRRRQFDGVADVDAAARLDGRVGAARAARGAGEAAASPSQAGDERGLLRRGRAPGHPRDAISCWTTVDSEPAVREASVFDGAMMGWWRGMMEDPAEQAVDRPSVLLSLGARVLNAAPPGVLEADLGTPPFGFRCPIGAAEGEASEAMGRPA